MIDVHRLHLTDVSPAPDLPWTRPTFPVFAYLVLHPVGPILIETGVGTGNAFIDELCAPIHHDLDDALDRYGVGVDDIATVITPPVGPHRGRRRNTNSRVLPGVMEREQLRCGHSRR